MATRISLIRSARQREERQQIGSMTTNLARVLLEAEKRCLLQISSAARDARQTQIALNSVVRAQKLEPSFEASREFAGVLWLHDEEKRAVQLLTTLRDTASSHPKTPLDVASMNARLVGAIRLLN